MSLAQLKCEVSVVLVTHFWSESLLTRLRKIESQLHAFERSELLVVANTSLPMPDSFKNWLKDAPKVTVLPGDSRQSSYEARNRALGCAQFEIIAFTDSDCDPEKDWLVSGADLIHSGHADIVGGRVHFSISDPLSGASLYDSLAFLQMKDCVEKRKVALTLNLFTKKSVFRKVGLFNTQTKSGADISWTQSATDRGFKIAYSELASISHPARNAAELLQKAVRVGLGKADLHWNLSQAKNLIQFHLMNPRVLWTRAKYLGRSLNPYTYVSACCFAWLVVGAAALAFGLRKLQIAFVSPLAIFSKNTSSTRPLGSQSLK